MKKKKRAGRHLLLRQYEVDDKVAEVVVTDHYNGNDGSGGGTRSRIGRRDCRLPDDDLPAMGWTDRAV